MDLTTSLEVTVPGFLSKDFKDEFYAEALQLPLSRLVLTFFDELGPIEQLSRRINHNALWFILGEKISFTDAYLNAADRFRRDEKCNPQMLGKVQVEHWGTTSFSFRCQLFHASTGELFSEHEMKIVGVDEMTRLPKKFPEEISMQIRAKIPNKPIVVLPQAKLSDQDVLWKKIVIDEQYIDFNGHVSVNFYTQFTLSAIVAGVCQGFLEGFGRVKDVQDVIVKSVSVSFQGESRRGDVINAGVWQEKNNPSIVYGVVANDEKVFASLRLEVVGVAKPDYWSSKL